MTANEKIKVGLVTHAGGAHVSAYLNALKSSDECGAVVLADRDGRFQADARRVLGAKLTSSFRDHKMMLKKERPAMALVTMEAKLAPVVIADALQANCHVFAEKPACVEPSSFKKLTDSADGKHRYLMLALANRTNPEIQKAKQLVKDGVIGKLFGVDMHLIADQTRLTRPSYHQNWFAKKDRAGGGHLIWLGIHWLDLAMYVSDSSITQVAGFTTNIGGQPIDIEDSATAALRFENGMLGTLTSGYYLDKGYHSHIKIWGSQGWLQINPTETQPLRWHSSKGSAAGKIQEFTGSKNPRGYTPFVEAAISACRRMAEPPISNHDSLRALKTVFAIYQAASSRRTVAIS